MKAGAVVFGWNQQKGLNNQTLFHESFLLLYEILLLVGLPLLPYLCSEK
jgi:hypothetical protein